MANHTPSRQLLKEVRSVLILKDSSLSNLADELGLQRQNLTKALVGDWKGPKANRIVARVCHELLCEGGS